MNNVGFVVLKWFSVRQNLPIIVADIFFFALGLLLALKLGTKKTPVYLMISAAGLLRGNAPRIHRGNGIYDVRRQYHRLHNQTDKEREKPEAGNHGKGTPQKEKTEEEKKEKIKKRTATQCCRSFFAYYATTFPRTRRGNSGDTGMSSYAGLREWRTSISSFAASCFKYALPS